MYFKSSVTTAETHSPIVFEIEQQLIYTIFKLLYFYQLVLICCIINKNTAITRINTNCHRFIKKAIYKRESE